MNKININGVTITSGRSITITNGRVVVDGKDVTPDAKDIRIEVQGNVDSISADVCSVLTVTGDVAGDVSTQSGDVQCGNVGGDVETMSGDVRCGTVAGKVKTMSGDVRHG